MFDAFVGSEIGAEIKTLSLSPEAALEYNSFVLNKWAIDDIWYRISKRKATLINGREEPYISPLLSYDFFQYYKLWCQKVSNSYPHK